MQSILLYGIKQLLTLASGLRGQKKLFILIYHRVLDKPDFMRPGEVDKQVFSWQMNLLANYFNVLPLADALEKLQNNTLPSRAVSITFDDGYADNYSNALPILNNYQLPAIFFIASGYLNGGRMWNDSIIETIRYYQNSELDLTEIKLGIHDVSTDQKKAEIASLIIQKIKHLDPEKRNQNTMYISSLVKHLPDNLMLSFEQLIELYQSGMEIGGHTVTHPILAKIDEQQVKEEVFENKQTLEKILNTNLRYFAYPNGKPEQDYLSEQVKIIQENDYQAALSTQWGVSTRQSDLFQLPRFTPWDKTRMKFMLRMLRLILAKS